MTSKLQKDRTRHYFIEAARNIVLSDGVSNVTVRKIAEIAGFSYATIYNYFNDVNHLLWYVVMSFIDDVVRLLEPHVETKPCTLARIKTIYREYVQYFLHNPNVFRLIFLHQIGDLPEEFGAYESEPKLAPRLLSDLQDSTCRQLDEDDIPILARIVTSSIHGMLSLYLSNKTDQNPDDLSGDVDKMLEFLLLTST